MCQPQFLVVALDNSHNRSEFNSGSTPLDTCFATQVTQDIRRNVAKCFVAIDISRQRVAGYYTMSAAEIPLNMLPGNISKKLPRYPTIPAVRIGRFAVDKAYQGKGIGGALLADAIIKACNVPIGAYALLVDAKDDKAAGFYRHYGFIQYVGSPNTLFLALETAKRISSES